MSVFNLKGTGPYCIEKIYFGVVLNPSTDINNPTSQETKRKCTTAKRLKISDLELVSGGRLSRGNNLDQNMYSPFG